MQNYPKRLNNPTANYKQPYVINAFFVMHALLTLFPAERGERMAHCTAQNKPKRFKQPILALRQHVHEQALSFLTYEEKTRVD